MMKMLWRSNQPAGKLHSEEKMGHFLVGQGCFEGQLQSCTDLKGNFSKFLLTCQAIISQHLLDFLPEPWECDGSHSPKHPHLPDALLWDSATPVLEMHHTPKSPKITTFPSPSSATGPGDTWRFSLWFCLTCFLVEKTEPQLS